MSVADYIAEKTRLLYALANKNPHGFDVDMSELEKFDADEARVGLSDLYKTPEQINTVLKAQIDVVAKVIRTGLTNQVPEEGAVPVVPTPTPTPAPTPAPTPTPVLTEEQEKFITDIRKGGHVDMENGSITPDALDYIKWFHIGGGFIDSEQLWLGIRKSLAAGGAKPIVPDGWVYGGFLPNQAPIPHDSILKILKDKRQISVQKKEKLTEFPHIDNVTGGVLFPLYGVIRPDTLKYIQGYLNKPDATSSNILRTIKSQDYVIPTVWWEKGKVIDGVNDEQKKFIIEILKKPSVDGGGIMGGAIMGGCWLVQKNATIILLIIVLIGMFCLYNIVYRRVMVCSPTAAHHLGVCVLGHLQ